MHTRRVFGFTDIHWSMRDEHALSIATAAHRWFKPDLTVVGGDLLDCSAFARHPPSATDLDRQEDFAEHELNPASEFLDDLQGVSPQLAVLAGNHDEWFERWMARGDRGARACGALRPSRYLMRGRKHATWYPFDTPSSSPRSILRLHPKLVVIHGWATNKYAAERHLELAAPYSVIFHHTHRMEMRTGEDLAGNTRVSMSAGCLCSKSPTYLHGTPANWVHGVWVAYLGKHDFTLYPIPITQRGLVMPCGKEIRG